MCRLGLLPYAVIFHAALWLCERLLMQWGSVSASMMKLLSSSAGAIMAAIVGVPMELIKHRVQLRATTPRRVVLQILQR